MKCFHGTTVLGLLALSWTTTHAQSSSSCAAPSPSGSIRPSVASGYKLQVVATGLSKPRGIALDGAGNLLVVQSGSGVVSVHTLNDVNGCVTVGSSANLTGPLSLNHGIEISTDGKTLYASSTEEVYQWSYNAAARSISNQVTLVDGMTGTDHTTRTLLLSRKAPGMLTVSRGSTSNIDIESASLSSGHSQVKAFNLTAKGANPYDFNADGVRLGWGLRNEVGVGEHPVSGGIWGVENSADDMTRDGVDIHQNNPAEELNFLGYLDGTYSANQGANFGYPWCFTAWTPSELPMNGNITVGKQFAVDATSASNNQNQTDAYCAAQVAPRLSFQAHMAPLDIKFNSSGTQAWVTFHGSWDRTDPVGYKLSMVSFNSNGEPTDPSTSKTATTDIVSNADNSVCPGSCFRPVAMAIDTHGRIFMSSDASGEIYLLTKDASSAGASSSVTSSASSSRTSSATGTATSHATSTTSTASTTSTTTSGASSGYQSSALVAMPLLVLYLLLLI